MVACTYCGLRKGLRTAAVSQCSMACYRVTCFPSNNDRRYKLSPPLRVCDRLFRCWEDRKPFVWFWPLTWKKIVMKLKGNDAYLTSDIVKVIAHVRERLLLRLLSDGYLMGVLKGNKLHICFCCKFWTKMNIIFASFYLQVVAFILFYFYGLEQYMFDESLEMVPKSCWSVETRKHFPVCS